MKNSRPTKCILFALLVAAAAVVVTAEDDCAATLPELPSEIQEAKESLIKFCMDNADQYGDSKLQATIDDFATTLGDWFAFNRPDDEIELTRESWLNIWSEQDATFPNLPFLANDRDNGFQIVRNTFFYNLDKIDFEIDFNIFDLDLFDDATITFFSFSNYLRADYSIVDLKTDFTCGQTERNVLEFEYVRRSFQLGFPERSEDLTDLVRDINTGRDTDGIGLDLGLIPFEQFNTGKLWNIFVDEDLRVFTGVGGENEDEDLGIFVQIRDDFANY